jgi:hypothetical protein
VWRKTNMPYKVMEGDTVLGVGATADAAIADAASKLKLPAEMGLTPQAVVEHLLANDELELVPALRLVCVRAGTVN